MTPLLHVDTQRKLVTYKTGYAGKSPLKLSYDNSLFKGCSSAVGRGDGPVYVGAEARKGGGGYSHMKWACAALG